MGIDQVNRHAHSSDTDGGDTLNVGAQIGIPVFASDAEAPAGTLYLNSGDGDWKYKDDQGDVVNHPISNIQIDGNVDWGGNEINNVNLDAQDYSVLPVGTDKYKS